MRYSSANDSWAGIYTTKKIDLSDVKYIRFTASILRVVNASYPLFFGATVNPVSISTCYQAAYYAFYTTRNYTFEERDDILVNVEAATGSYYITVAGASESYVRQIELVK